MSKFERCYNCIHRQPCGAKGGLSQDGTICNHFKDKTLFVELPCKVGDVVYVIEYCRCINIDNYYLKQCHKKVQHNTPEILARVMKLKQGRVLEWNGFDKVLKWKDKEVICYKLRQKPFNLKMITEIGKTVFLDRAEAERKLKEENK